LRRVKEIQGALSKPDAPAREEANPRAVGVGPSSLAGSPLPAFAGASGCDELALGVLVTGTDAGRRSKPAVARSHPTPAASPAPIEGTVMSRHVLALLLLSFLVAASSADDKKDRPNVIFILADDLGWTDLGCQGSKYYETPHVDKLAKQGMRFTNGYS